eukprot:357597-Chlamydomonas_euryale.AAC.7
MVRGPTTLVVLPSGLNTRGITISPACARIPPADQQRVERHVSTHVHVHMACNELLTARQQVLRLSLDATMPCCPARMHVMAMREPTQAVLGEGRGGANLQWLDEQHLRARKYREVDLCTKADEERQTQLGQDEEKGPPINMTPSPCVARRVSQSAWSTSSGILQCRVPADVRQTSTYLRHDSGEGDKNIHMPAMVRLNMCVRTSCASNVQSGRAG